MRYMIPFSNNGRYTELIAYVDDSGSVHVMIGDLDTAQEIQCDISEMRSLVECLESDISDKERSEQ